jgi:hypothetical protein
MIFFDFLYYSIFKFYARHKEKGALSTAAGIVGGFQTINVIALIMLFSLTQKRKVRIEKWVVIVLLIVFQVTTYIRYVYREKPLSSEIEQKWLDKTPSSRKQLGTLLFIYGAVSIIAFLGLAILGGISK